MLGPKLTKDALVQGLFRRHDVLAESHMLRTSGCMCMRKMGHGHLVMFFAPPGVDRSIRVVVSKTDLNMSITTVDILCWTIHETCTDIQHQAPYWAQQGMSHNTRYTALSRFYNNEITLQELSDAWLQPERKSLADLYKPRNAQKGQSDLVALDSGIRQRCKSLGVL